MEGTQKKSGIFYGWIVVIGCVLINATVVPLIMAVAGLYQRSVVVDLGIADKVSLFTFVNLILQALGIFLSPIAAKKLSHGNMKLLQSVAIAGFAVAYSTYSFATNIVHLYISAIVIGIFYIFAALIPVSIMVTNWFEKKRGLAMSIAMAGIGVGGFILSPVVSALLVNVGWRWTYRIMAIVILVIALPISLFVLKKKPEDMGLQPYGHGEDDGAAAGAKAAKPGHELAIKISVKESHSKPFFWLLLLGMFANGIINMGVLAQGPSAIKFIYPPGGGASMDLPAAIALAGIAVMILSVLGIPTKLLLGAIEDKFGIVKAMIFGCLMFALAVAILFAANWMIQLVYVYAIVFALGNPIGTVIPPLICAAIYGKEKYAEGYGLANSIMQIGLSIGSFVVAFMKDIFQSYQPAWVLVFVFCILAMIGWVGAYNNSRKYC